MFINLLAAIEADINAAKQKMLQTEKEESWNSQQLKQWNELAAKKEQLSKLAMEYIGLQNRYREVSGANSVY